MAMPWIHYLRDDRRIEIRKAETLLDASLRAGIPHAHACGGQARCSTCRIRIVQGRENCLPRNGLEEELAQRLHLCPEIRLACQTTLTGDVTVRRMVLDAEDAAIVRDTNAQPGPVSIGEEKTIAILFADI